MISWYENLWEPIMPNDPSALLILKSPWPRAPFAPCHIQQYSVLTTLAQNRTVAAVR